MRGGVSEVLSSSSSAEYTSNWLSTNISTKGCIGLKVSYFSDTKGKSRSPDHDCRTISMVLRAMIVHASCSCPKWISSLGRQSY